MKSKKPSPGGDRVQLWHKENDRLVYSALMMLARQETPPSLTNEDSAHIPDLIDKFQQCCPPLDRRDVMGLVVLRLTSDLWCPGKGTELGAELSTLQALSLATAVAPLAMQRAGLAVPRVLHPQATPRLLMIHAQHVRRRWQSWVSETLNPRVPCVGERQAVVRGLARLHCLRHAADEQAVARKTRGLLDAYFRRRGYGGTNLDAEDILAELYAMEREQTVKARILWLRPDGAMGLDERSIRDVLRASMFASPPAAGPAGPDEVAGSASLDPSRQAAQAEQLARLIDQGDQTDRLIIENWDSRDTDLAKQLSLSPQAVGKRRRGIEARARRGDRQTPG